MPKVTKIKSKITGTVFDIHDTAIETSVAAAEAAAARAATSAATAERVFTTTKDIIGGDNIKEFNAADTYEVNDLVYYNDKMYKCLVAHTSGTGWIASSWQETSCYGLMMGDAGGSETVTLTVISVQGSSQSIIANHSVTVNDNGNTATYVTNSNGVITFRVKKGHVFTISVNAIEGYNTPPTRSYIASAVTRSISMVYSYIYPSGYVVITSNGLEIPWESYYDEDNSVVFEDYRSETPMFLRYQNSNAKLNVPLSGITIANRQWATQNVKFPNVPKYQNGNVMANYNHLTDYDGVGNTALILADAAELTGQGTIVSAPAAEYCNGLTQTIHYNAGDVVAKGYLPSIAELVLLGQLTTSNDFVAKYNILQGVISGSISFNINSGPWFSSCQFSETGAWNLNYGGVSSNGKTNAGTKVLPLFDF